MNNAKTDNGHQCEQGQVCAITAIVTAYQRIDQTLTTLAKIRSCDPQPSEIIVHVDGNQIECEAAIKRAFPDVELLRSVDNIGPGGSRNKLIAAAKNDLVASFDDDSYPLDSNYFFQLSTLFERFPDAVVISSVVCLRGHAVPEASNTEAWVADFSGGACGLRRQEFLSSGGYVPLVVAYGMEEVDLALRFLASGKKTLYSSSLRVFHDTNLDRHAAPEVTRSGIANLALLCYLRYPRSLWWRGIAQVMNRIAWLMKHHRFNGILSGIIMIPRYLWMNRRFRQRLPASMVRSYLRLRRRPVAINMF